MSTERKENPPAKKERRPYTKPKVERTELVPDDSLLSICKVPSGCPGHARRPSHS